MKLLLFNYKLPVSVINSILTRHLQQIIIFLLVPPNQKQPYTDALCIKITALKSHTQVKSDAIQLTP